MVSEQHGAEREALAGRPQAGPAQQLDHGALAQRLAACFVIMCLVHIRTHQALRACQ
jgi:hypothetical protein